MLKIPKWTFETPKLLLDIPTECWKCHPYSWELQDKSLKYYVHAWISWLSQNFYHFICSCCSLFIVFIFSISSWLHIFTYDMTSKDASRCWFFIAFCFNLFAGVCLFLTNQNSVVNAYNCQNFSEGCPRCPYFSDEIYKCKQVLKTLRNHIYFLPLMLEVKCQKHDLWYVNDFIRRLFHKLGIRFLF